MKKKLSLLPMVMALTALTAGTAPVFAAHSNACKDDIAKFCSDVDASDHKAVHACLQQHQNDVSDACKAQMARHKKSSSSSSTNGTSSSTTPPATTGSTTGQ